MSLTWQELKTLLSPDSGSEDKVYGVHWNALMHHGLLKGLGYIVYYYTKNGTTYYAALNGKTGEIGFGGEYNAGEVNGTDPTSVIQAALNGLTANRTWKEKVVVMGKFEGLDQIVLPSYCVLEILGSLKAKNGLNKHFILAQNQQMIEICGGIIDSNIENQTQAMNTIHFYNVVDSEVHGCYIYNGRRPPDAGVYGEGISLEESARVDIHDNIFDTRATAAGRGYDMIKVRQNSHHCTVRGNIIKFYGNTGYSLGIQLSSGAYCNTVMGNTIHSNDAGVKIHSGHENVVIGNTIVARCLANGALELIGNSSRNIFAHNFATSDAQDMAFVGFRMEGAGEEQWDNMVIGNLFKLPNVANSVGILMDYQTSGGARRTIIRGNKILGGTASDTGISLSSLSQDCVIEDNDLRDPNLNTKIVVAGSGHIIRRNLGYPTENQGRASVAQGQTSVTIAHGLVSTPSVVKALPEWLTTVRLSSKDATNIVLEFGTAAPTGGSYVNWDAAV